MIKVNLVPAEILAKALQKQRVIQAAVAGAMVVFLLLAVSVLHWVKLERLDSKLAKDEAALKKLEVIVAKVEELERTAAAVRSRLNVINDLLKGRPLYPTFMSDFARSVPVGVRVRSLTTAGGGSSAGPVKLNVSAESRTNEDIAGWVKKMEDSGRFGAVELGPVSAIEGAERMYNFTLTSVYTPSL